MIYGGPVCNRGRDDATGKPKHKRTSKIFLNLFKEMKEEWDGRERDTLRLKIRPKNPYDMTFSRETCRLDGETSVTFNLD